MTSGNRKGDGAKLVIIELTKRTITDEKLLGEKIEKLAKPKKKSKVSTKDEVATEQPEIKKVKTSSKVGSLDKEGKVKDKVKKEKAKVEEKK